MVEFTKRIDAITTASINDILCPALDGAIAANAKAEYEAGRGSGEGSVAKKRIGAGYIGIECHRELGFRYHKYPKEDRPSAVSKGELQRHAQSGHWTEEKTADWLRLAGFVIRTDTGRLNTFGKPEQIGWKAAIDQETGQYRMAGEVDGVIDAVPDYLKSLIKPPCIWESKKATDKKWKKFCKLKVKGSDPRYYGQLQSNMAYMGVEQTLFSMLNLDNMKYYFEVITIDAPVAQSLSDRAVRTMQSNDPFELPKLCRSDDDFNGMFCEFHGQCQLGLKLPLPDAAPPSVEKTDAAVVPTRHVFNPNFNIKPGEKK